MVPEDSQPNIWIDLDEPEEERRRGVSASRWRRLRSPNKRRGIHARNSGAHIGDLKDAVEIRQATSGNAGRSSRQVHARHSKVGRQGFRQSRQGQEVQSQATEEVGQGNGWSV
jgi:hypothetical protein